MNSGSTVKNVAQQFSILPNTVRKMYATYRRTNNVAKVSSGHRQPKLSLAQKEQICNWIDDDCSITLRQLREKCLNEWPLLQQISLSTIDRALKSFHYSFKRTSFVPERRNIPEIIQARFDYAVHYNRIMLEREKIYFIDEYGIQVNSRVSYGRSIIKYSSIKNKRRTKRTQLFCCCCHEH